MKVEFLKPIQGFAHVPGEVSEIEDEEAKKYIELGFCVQAKEEIKEEIKEKKEGTKKEK